MKTELLINGKKVSKQEAIAQVGEERLGRLIKSAKEQFKEDPMVENDFMISGGIMTISFK